MWRWVAGSGNITRVVEHDYFPQRFEDAVVLIRRGNGAVAKGLDLNLPSSLAVCSSGTPALLKPRKAQTSRSSLLFGHPGLAQEITQTTVDIICAVGIKR